MIPQPSSLPPLHLHEHRPKTPSIVTNDEETMRIVKNIGGFQNKLMYLLRGNGDRQKHAVRQILEQ